MHEPPVTAEIIAIGDELTSGVRLDTNTQWISRELLRIGVHVSLHTCVGDQLEDITSAMRAAARRADVIITTGGLGPTADDLTREALAKVAGVSLELHAASLAHIEKIFATRKRNMPERNRQQAMLPIGAEVIPNPHGTAPGITMRLSEDAQVFCLPGVPAELKEMWGTVATALKAAYPLKVTVHHELHCFGAGESEIESMLPDLVRRGRDPSVGITASQATITLRVTSSAINEIQCREKMKPTVRTIREALGGLIFGENGEQLQDAVCKLLSERNETLATVELGPAGQLALWLAESDELRWERSTDSRAAYKPCFVGAAVRGMATDSRIAFQNSDNEHPTELIPLANSALEEQQADWVLCVGAYPRQEQANDATTFPVVIASRQQIAGYEIDQRTGFAHRFRDYPFSSHPAIARVRAAKIALNALRKELLKQSVEGDSE